MVIIKYIWVVMLAIGYIIWLCKSIKDIRYCRRVFNNWINFLNDSTYTFIIINIVVLFGFSLMYFILGGE